MTAAIYCRLSKEDEDNRQISESIRNQRSLLIKYAREQGWDIYNVYSDEDYSGADRDRPEFNRLIADARRKLFNIVLVKTQSRFTRDMECVEKYIHGLFPVWGIRFIAVVENADTEIKGNKKARQINGLINEWYLEDLSENIRAVLDCKRKNGQYIGGFAVYGYSKAPENKNKLIIDSEAAGVVQEIFKLFLQGNGKTKIANILNARGIPNPTKYKELKGLGYVNGCQKSDLGLWSRTTIGRILRDRMYTGDIVQGRRRKVSYKSKRLVQVPRKDWIVVENTHEPIIERDMFETVGRLLSERTKSQCSGNVHTLAGKVKCMDCGSAMVKTSNTYKGKTRSYLRCGLYASDKSRCMNHSIRLDKLEDIVRQATKRYITKYYDKNNIEALFSEDRRQSRKEALVNEKISLERLIERRVKGISALYMDKACGVIGSEQFNELNAGFLEERAGYQKRLERIKAELDGKIRDAYNKQRLIEEATKELEFDALPRELVASLIGSVEIGQPGAGTREIRINWLF